MIEIYGDKTNELECKTCIALREQIAYLQTQNKELLETLTALIKPAPIVIADSNNAEAVKPLNMNGRFTRVRAELEKRDREQALTRSSKSIARPDVAQNPIVDESIEKLESELGVS